MPQTREHLAICDLLGLSHGVVALTKIDLADATWRSWPRRRCGADRCRHSLAAAPILRVSSLTGRGHRDAARGSGRNRQGERGRANVALRPAAALGGPALRGEGIRERRDRHADRWKRSRWAMPWRSTRSGRGPRARAPELRRLRRRRGQAGRALRGEPAGSRAGRPAPGPGGLGARSASADPGTRWT